MDICESKIVFAFGAITISIVVITMLIVIATVLNRKMKKEIWKDIQKLKHRDSQLSAFGIKKA